MNWLLVLIAGLVVLLVLAAGAVYWTWKNPPGTVRCRKTLVRGMSTVEMEAHRDLDEVIVEDGKGRERIRMARSRITKGDRIEFEYPASLKTARITLRYEGREERIEVEPT